MFFTFFWLLFFWLAKLFIDIYVLDFSLKNIFLSIIFMVIAVKMFQDKFLICQSVYTVHTQSFFQKRTPKARKCWKKIRIMRNIIPNIISKVSDKWFKTRFFLFVVSICKSVVGGLFFFANNIKFVGQMLQSKCSLYRRLLIGESFYPEEKQFYRHSNALPITIGCKLTSLVFN